MKQETATAAIANPRTSQWIYRAYAAFALIYFGFMLLRPISPTTVDHYDISSGQLLFIRLLLLIPILSIWFVAFYGYAKLREYTAAIASTNADGTGLQRITNGIGVLAFGLPVIAIITNVMRLAIQRWPDFSTAGFMIRNYSELIIVFIAFILILQGALRMEHFNFTNKVRLRLRGWSLVLLYILAALLYAYLSITHRSLQFLGEPVIAGDGGRTFFLPVWLKVVTLVVPYFITWTIGLSGVYLIYAHRLHVKGKLYRDFLGNLAGGLTIVIIASITIQYFHILAASINTLPLILLILVVFMLFGIMAGGYLLIARGASQLKRIEEV